MQWMKIGAVASTKPSVAAIANERGTLRPLIVRYLRPSQVPPMAPTPWRPKNVNCQPSRSGATSTIK
jgi:hypothetical protein